MNISELPRMELKMALSAELCKRSFFRFFLEFWPEFSASEYSHNWHIKYLCGELQECYNRLRRGEPARNIVINIPPGTSKSSIVTIAFPVWLWVNDPSLKIISASYSERIALTHSVKSRDIVKSDKFKLFYPDIEIKRDVDGKTWYETVQMGARFTTSVGGSCTGLHASGCIILDDPLSSEGATSEVFRNRANVFISETLSTRKVNKTTVPIIVVMQRLHVNDCTGYMLARDPDIIHICLPGELSSDVKPESLKESYTGGMLDVGRLNRAALDRLKIDLGSYAYAGQIQQTPAPLTNTIWNKDWFNIIADADFPSPDLLEGYGTDWDLAYTEKDTNSASAFVTSGKKDNKMYIDRIGFSHLEFPKLIDMMRALPCPHYIEGKASGKSAKQTLSALGIPAIEVQVSGGDKVARAKLSTPFAEAGLINVRQSICEKLFGDASQGILFFPMGSHDDLADALAQSIQRQLKMPEFWVN